MGKFIAVVDYGLGNLRSVSKALETVGAKVKVTNEPKDIVSAVAIVLPGVGAFRRAMHNLKELKILPSITKAIKQGKPFLGICLGLQVLFSESEEHGKSRGMDVIKGKVKKFSSDLKIPHMGWNRIKFKTKNKKCKIFAGVPDGSYFYFVHSYYVQPEEQDTVVARTEYGEEFVSAINKDNLWGLSDETHPVRLRRSHHALTRLLSDNSCSDSSQIQTIPLRWCS